MKIFIGHEKDDAEVPLNFNTALYKSEFSTKDEEYGDTCSGISQEFSR